MKPLEGYLVVSIDQAVAAPLATARLVDAGARVIKIERQSGDFARGYDIAAKGDSSYFAWTNQGKESVVLDFKQADDKAMLEALISKADIFVQNLAPGALDRAGFGSKELRARNPRLITCDISGYGDMESVAGMKAYDLLVQAEAGLIGISGGQTELGRIGVSICDIGAGMTAHAAIMEAVLRRERFDVGASLKVSLFDVAAEWMTVPLVHNDYGAGPPSRQGLRHPTVAPYGAYRCNDGIDIIISVQNEREWQRLCEAVLGRPGLAVDQRFNSNNNRVENRDDLEDAIQAIAGELSSSEFKSRLMTASIAYGGINTVSQVSEHPALRRREARASGGGDMLIPALPARWVGEERGGGTGAPSLGQHTDAVRAEFMGNAG